MAEAYANVTMIYVNVAGVRLNLQGALDTASCFIETKDLDGGLVDTLKHLQKIVSSIIGRESSPNLTLEIKYRNKLSEPLKSAGTWKIFDDDETFTRVPAAVYYRFRFSDTAISTLWKLARFSLFGEVGGTRI